MLIRRIYFIAAFVFVHLFSKGQASNVATRGNPKKASFTTVIDISRATKDGIYIEGYIVNIPYRRLEELNGKTVRIKGRVTVVKAIDQSVDHEVMQGKETDALHILKPTIKIIGD